MSSAPLRGLPEPREPLVGARVAYGLAALSGVLYFLGVPGMNAWPMAFVAHVPLLVALRGRTPRTAATLGLVAGFVGSVGGFYWLYGMLRLFGGMPRPLCFVIMLAMCAYQGGRLAATCWLTERAATNGWSASLAFVLASITAELVYPLLFPWYLVFMMHRTPLLLQTADLGGVYLAGALLLGPNLALAEVVRALRERTRIGRVVVAAGFAAPILGAAYGAYRMNAVHAVAASSERLTVGLAQGNLPLITRKGGVLANSELSATLKEKGARLVVWSESSIPDVLDEDKLKNPSYGKVTSMVGVPVIFGANTRRKVPGGARELNSAFLADAAGNLIGRYDKQYLLPFGEFIPFGETFPTLYRYSPNSGHMIAGDSVKPVVLDGHPITVLICYEDILPWFVSRAVAEGHPELLVNITVDTWFGDTIEPWEHLALAQLRAVEHRRFLVRATNSGISAIVDPTGAVTTHGGMSTREALLGDVRFMTASTVYELVGDVPWYLVALASVALAMIPRRGRVTVRA